MKTITAKLGNMRKAASWTVYPDQGDGLIRLQSDHRCCYIETKTKVGYLSKHVANYPTFLHCNTFMGGVKVEVPDEVIKDALEATPVSGDQIGPGVIIA